MGPSLEYWNENICRLTDHVEVFWSGVQVDCAFSCCSLPSSQQNPQKSRTPYAMASSYNVDELGDFLLEEGIPGDIVTSFTGTLTCFSWMYM